MSLAPGTRLGPYQIAAPIGAGGMGEVYRARDTRLGRDVAIKVIPAELSRDPDRIKRFEQEARAAGALSHPNVCAIYDVGTHEGAPYVVMELLEGESLQQRLVSGPVPLRKALDYAAQIAHGLAAAHEKGIVHRDLKPGNVFVTKSGRVKVLDFGLAKLTRPDVLAPTGDVTASIAATETGAILGTVGYMSPEQVRGERADHRSDLFALGTILYELLTGKRAFHGATYVETLNAILKEDPAPLTQTVGSGRGIPPAVDLIVRRCLEKAPEQRFQSASDLAFDLESGSTSALGMSGSATTHVRKRPGVRIAAAFMVGVLLAAGAAIILTQQRHIVDPARLEYIQLTAERGFIWTARFSPDEKTILYNAEWGGHKRAVFETRPGVPGRAIDLPPGVLLRSVSSTGMMAIGIGDFSLNIPTLAEVSIGGGAPRRILDNVRAADWAPDGKTIAVSHFVDGKFRLEMPPGNLLYTGMASVQRHGLRVAPDGKHVLLVESPNGLGSLARLVVIDRKGQVLARTEEGIGEVACWSPNGQEVWFTRWAGGDATDLVAMSLNERQRIVARLDGGLTLCDIGRSGDVLLKRETFRSGIRGGKAFADEERELGWYDASTGDALSADGQSLLFTYHGIYSDSVSWVCLRGMDGSPPMRLGEGSGMDLSPDGSWALALHPGPPPRLVLLPTGAGDVLSLPRGTIDVYYGAGWMPDGKSVWFLGAEARRARRNFLQEINGGAPRPITPEGDWISAISPDGRRIVFQRGWQDLYIRSTEGGDERLVTKIRPGEWVLQWAADGKSLYVGEGYGGDAPPGRYRVNRMDLATGRRTAWRTFDVPDPAGAQIRENVLLTRDGSAYAYSYRRILSDLYLVRGLK